MLNLYVFIAGIKEGLYSAEALADYLLYRLNVINPSGELSLLFFFLPSFPAQFPTD